MLKISSVWWKKLKLQLNRNALPLLYTSFIRPQLEYASDVWGGCSSSDCDRLEKIQLIAAGIVTGLSIFVSGESLYFETGWDTLSTRRKISRLKTMHKIDRNLLYYEYFSRETNQYMDLQYQKFGKLLYSQM